MRIVTKPEWSCDQAMIEIRGSHHEVVPDDTTSQELYFHFELNVSLLGVFFFSHEFCFVCSVPKLWELIVYVNHFVFKLLISGTGINWQSCPAGTYSNQEGLYEESQCIACPGGKYCDSEHLTTFAGDCDPGRYFGAFQKHLWALKS